MILFDVSMGGSPNSAGVVHSPFRKRSMKHYGIALLPIAKHSILSVGQDTFDEYNNCCTY